MAGSAILWHETRRRVVLRARGSFVQLTSVTKVDVEYCIKEYDLKMESAGSPLCLKRANHRILLTNICTPSFVPNKGLFTPFRRQLPSPSTICLIAVQVATLLVGLVRLFSSPCVLPVCQCNVHRTGSPLPSCALIQRTTPLNTHPSVPAVNTLVAKYDQRDCPKRSLGTPRLPVAILSSPE